MKHILMALAITFVAYSGAEAQSCGLVPKHVCKISPDRRSVNCYSSQYGVTVIQPYQQRVNTSATHCFKTDGILSSGSKMVVIKDNVPKDFCKRDNTKKESECSHSGYTICRDDNGLYNYCKLPLQTESGSLSSR